MLRQNFHLFVMLARFGDAGMEHDLFQLDTLPRDSYDCCPLYATEAGGWPKSKKQRGSIDNAMQYFNFFCKVSGLDSPSSQR